MSYTVLARKYRPQTFADLVGQEHVSRTIGNAIAGGRVAHAFLFTGARGVGKTTTARLLAKALNCEQGPTAQPCNACDPCRDITTGIDLDVLEIDGASNNSVDDVRRLQETLPFRPARDRFKVVIVDEVHMLSTGAFNAFLKTLEEPPSHVKFIFATTEVHKVPVTIRSRCQRYDFRLIPDAVVAQRVRAILDKEEITADDAAISVVAREAAGSMRDALTVLDQLLAQGAEQLRGEDVAAGLGIAGRKLVFSVLSALLSADAATCLRTVNEIGAQGLDMLHFARQVLEFSRDLVVLRVLGDAEDLVDLVPEEREEAQRLAQSASREELERAFAGLGKLVEEVGHSSTPQITLEMGLVRLADRPQLLPLKELLERLRSLEERLSAPQAGPGGPGGSRGPSGPGGAAGGGGAGRFTPPGRSAASSGPAPTRASGSAPQRSELPAGPSAAPTWKREPARAPVFTPPVMQAAANAGAATAAAQALQTGPAPLSVAPPAPSAVAAPAASTATASRAPSALPAVAQPAAAPPAESAAKSAGAAARPEPAPGLPGDGALPATWLQIVAQLKQQQPALSAVLEHAMPLEISAAKLRLGFPEGSFFGRQAQSSSAREAVLRTAEAILGARPELVITSQAGETMATVAKVEQHAKSEHERARRQVALSHPSVRDALEVFEESEHSVRVQLDSAD